MRPANTRERSEPKTRPWRAPPGRLRLLNLAGSVRVKAAIPLLRLRSVAKENPPCRSR